MIQYPIIVLSMLYYRLYIQDQTINTHHIKQLYTKFGKVKMYYNVRKQKKHKVSNVGINIDDNTSITHKSIAHNKTSATSNITLVGKRKERNSKNRAKRMSKPISVFCNNNDFTSGKRYSENINHPNSPLRSPLQSFSLSPSSSQSLSPSLSPPPSRSSTLYQSSTNLSKEQKDLSSLVNMQSKKSQNNNEFSKLFMFGELFQQSNPNALIHFSESD